MLLGFTRGAFCKTIEINIVFLGVTCSGFFGVITPCTELVLFAVVAYTLVSPIGIIAAFVVMLAAIAGIVTEAQARRSAQ